MKYALSLLMLLSVTVYGQEPVKVNKNIKARKTSEAPKSTKESEVISVKKISIKPVEKKQVEATKQNNSNQ